MKREVVPVQSSFLAVVVTLSVVGQASALQPASFRSHPPMRPLPVAPTRPLSKGPALFVDPLKGADRNRGSQEAPFKTIGHAVKQLEPGATLYLRGGTYYECVTVTVHGTADRLITIRSYPGELAILDGGIREFREDPAAAWERCTHGAADEFRSTRTYAQGGGAGNFADSMVPLHRYLNFHDLRSENELWHAGLGARQDDPRGIYCGPGVRRDPETGRIHVRLAHTKLAGLGEHAYRGETDPRKLPLVIAGHEYTLRIEGARHLHLQDLVVCGAQRSAVLIAEDAEDNSQDAEDITLEGMTLYGSGSALQVRHTRGLKVIDCALHGHAAPWHSRAHHKYRAFAGYLVVAAGKDFEFAHCDFTDHHDALQLYLVDGLRFHHNFVDNFNDDGIEMGPRKERGQAYLYENVFRRCLNPFTLHGKPGVKPAPIASEAGSGVYICRNVIDFRQGTYRTPPAQPDPSGAFLNSPTLMLAHDHGSPIHPNYYVYHNTCLLSGNAFRGYYAFSWGSHTHATTRRVFNNICVQLEGVPGVNFAVAPDDDFQADANLIWCVKAGPTWSGDVFAKFRRSSLFAASKKQYPPGWGAHDLVADPKLVRLDADDKGPLDARLQKGSPAVDAGVDLPADWFDPLRAQDQGKPDIGALPLGVDMFRAGRAHGSRGR